MAGTVFYGVLDMQRWDKLDNAQRKGAAKKLSDILEKENRLQDALIARPNGRVAIFFMQGQKLRVSKEALRAPVKP